MPFRTTSLTLTPIPNIELFLLGLFNKIQHLLTIIFKCFLPGLGQLANCQWKLTFEHLFNIYIPRFFQLAEMGRQVAFCQVGFTLQEEKICAFNMWIV